MVAESMPQGIGASGWQTVLAVFVGDFGLDCYEINISDDLEKGLRSSERQKLRTRYKQPTQATACYEYYRNCLIKHL